MKKRCFLFSLAVLWPLSVCTSCKKTNDAEIALVTDISSLKDGGFNEGTWNGIQAYAKKNGKTCQYYQPANGANATDDDRIVAMTLAIENAAKIIVVPGFLQGKAIRQMAINHPKVKFVFIDGFILKDDEDKELQNVTAIRYKEEEAGYLAGYSAYAEGYRKLGGTFGGGGSNSSCNRFAYGYVQGINEAAKKSDGPVADVKISYKYGSSFGASTDLQTQMASWYQSGIEIIFGCGGSMIHSVVSASNLYPKAKIIGVDIDQSSLSPRVLTSATKNLESSVQVALKDYYAGNWESGLGGKICLLGAKEDAVSLPTSEKSWRFTNFKKEQYDEIYRALKEGKIKVVPAFEGQDYNQIERWKKISDECAKVNIDFEF